MRYTDLSERTVRTCLGRLEAEGLIRSCDPAVVAARIKRADRRPKGWDLDLSLIRADLAEDDIAALEYQFPGLAARVAAAQPGYDGHSDGCGHRTPSPMRLMLLWMTSVSGCSYRTPTPGRGATSAPAGCNLYGHGVQRLHPNRTWNHPGNPPPLARTRSAACGRCAWRRARW